MTATPPPPPGIIVSYAGLAVSKIAEAAGYLSALQALAKSYVDTQSFSAEEISSFTALAKAAHADLLTALGEVRRIESQLADTQPEGTRHDTSN